ncbi:hypothetical protein BTHE_1782 [Bifidobacterium thermophilum]|nr:hypothetical protein BTHE_1782 [Bifidobacterium thermophilum]
MSVEATSPPSADTQGHVSVGRGWRKRRNPAVGAAGRERREKKGFNYGVLAGLATGRTVDMIYITA